MAFKDNLRPASFRGVSFFIDSSQYTGGRRVTFHEFPDRDVPYPEDLGKVGKTWKVEGHLLGEKYFETRDKLIEAVDKFGPGEFVHPYYGSLNVQCGAFSIDEDNKEGAYAKVSFQFYEAGDNRYPKAVDNKRAVLGDLSSAAKAAAKGDFDSLFSIAKMPGFAVDSARAAVANAALMFEKATRNVVATIEGIANLAYGIRNLRAEVNDLLQAPGKLSQRLLDSLDLLTDAIDLPRGQFSALSSGFAFGSTDTPVRGNTPTRERERENKDAFDKFMKRTTVASAVAIAANVEFESVEEASKVRNQLRDLIDDILLNTDNDEVFVAFKDLNAQLAIVLPDADTSLPEIKTVTVNDTQPSLVVAYDLFGNPNVEADLVTRNAIRHPGFITGGTELEVLNVGA